MKRTAATLAELLFGRRARLRWVHLLLGGALSMPYFLLASVPVGPLSGERNLFLSIPFQLLAFAAALPVAAASGLFPVVRSLETAAARALFGAATAEPASGPASEPAESWAARRRTAVWFTLHLGLGGVVSALSLAVPPMAAVLLALPFVPALRDAPLGLHTEFLGGPGLVLAPLTGAGLLLALAAVSAGAGALLARLLPALLGPSPADRLAAAERRAAALAVRNRLARELHDSVGHALSAVTLQASAARRVLDSDPGFARQALEAIEETARRTVGELDTVLGLLRDEGEGGAGAARAPGPTLAELGGLLARTRAAGVPVDSAVGGELGRLPELLSREAYRIVQEGLSNALRHAGRVPVRLRITLDEEELVIDMVNPLAAADGDRPVRSGGGRGLRGIGERAALLHGRSEAGSHQGMWRLSVRLPAGSAR